MQAEILAKTVSDIEELTEEEIINEIMKSLSHCNLEKLKQFIHLLQAD